MPEHTLIRDIVMDAIANDYEDFTTILQEVTTCTRERGLRIEREEVAAILVGLINNGLAKAYRLSACSQIEVEGRPEGRVIEECYYLLTAEGTELVERGELN